MKTITINAENAEIIHLNSVGTEIPIFAKRGDTLIGMITNDDGLWSLRRGSIQKENGTWSRREDLISNCMSHGITFHIE